MPPEVDIPAWTILLAAILTDNILLMNFLGICSFLGLSRDPRTSVGMSGAVVFVTTATTMLNHQLYHRLLVPLELEHLQFIVFIVVIAAFVQLVEVIIERASSRLYHAMGIFLPLITVNCAILGTSLFMILRNYGFWQATAYGFGAGVGWSAAIYLMAGLRQRLRFSNIPTPLRGLGITMILTGLMALAFMGFQGMVRAQ